MNLVATRACVNRSKGSRDAAEWSGVQSGACAGATLTTEGRCFWAARTVAVKHRYNLALDTSEHTAVEADLNQCPQDIDIAAPSLATITTIPATETPPTTETPPPESDCHPAYEPCLPNLPGDALNCGDLTAQQRPVRSQTDRRRSVPLRPRRRRTGLHELGSLGSRSEAAVAGPRVGGRSGADTRQRRLDQRRPSAGADTRPPRRPSPAGGHPGLVPCDSRR